MKKIVLIVGASGVGKDTLIKYAKHELKDDANFNFVTRYITRQPDDNELNFYLEKKAFDTLVQQKYFTSHWTAHENYYGIPKVQIQEKINIISISRSAIKDFESQFKNVLVINISIPKEELYARLKSRDRENEEEIQIRLERSYPLIEGKQVVHFDNSDELLKSQAMFLELLRSQK